MIISTLAIKSKWNEQLKFYFVVVFCFFSFYTYTQTQETNTLLKDADEKFVQKDYSGAEKLYSQAYIKDTANPKLNYKLGVCYFELNNYEKAESFFLKTTSGVSLELFRYKAAIAHFDHKFKKAINFYNGYKIINGKKDLTNDEINVLIAKSIYAESILQKPREVTIENLGASVNSKHDDYIPLISAGEDILLFTSRRPETTGKQVDMTGKFNSDIYFSNRNGSNWGKPIQLKQGINTDGNDACAGLSPDGQLLFIYRNSPKQKSNDLFETRMGLTEWETPIKTGDHINSTFNETYVSITPNDKIIYFSSNRAGGLGGIDIYKIERLPNGTWSKAVNLGPTINTPYDEESPFIHPDGKTLYFSSTGHQNMGGYDIFKTKLNETGEWSIPENIGTPINTVHDDIHFVLSADGKIGYYSSAQQGGYGGHDIFRVILKDEFENLQVIKGEITSIDDSKPLEAKITLIENETAKVQGIYKSKAGTGKFILIVEPNKTYNCVIQSDGYEPQTDELKVNPKNILPLNYKLKKK